MIAYSDEIFILYNFEGFYDLYHIFLKSLLEF